MASRLWTNGVNTTRTHEPNSELDCFSPFGIRIGQAVEEVLGARADIDLKHAKGDN